MRGTKALSLRIVLKAHTFFLRHPVYPLYLYYIYIYINVILCCHAALYKTNRVVFFHAETTILEDSTLDTTDTPGCSEETTTQDVQQEEDATTSEQTPSEGENQKEKKKKSSIKSKAHRPQHLN